MKPFVYVLHEESTDSSFGPWTRVKTYWPKADGPPPKALLDELAFMKPKPWTTSYQPTVKCTVYKYVLGDVVDIVSPDPQPITIVL